MKEVVNERMKKYLNPMQLKHWERLCNLDSDKATEGDRELTMNLYCQAGLMKKTIGEHGEVSYGITEVGKLIEGIK